MQIIYATEPAPNLSDDVETEYYVHVDDQGNETDVSYPVITVAGPEKKAIFLAGPSPRKPEHLNWRLDALRILEELKFPGTVFIPLPRNGIVEDYDQQVDWEQEMMNRSAVILFWIPRDLETLPGFSTNVEFGQKVCQRNIVVGFPPNSPKNKYIGKIANRHGHLVHDTLEKTIRAAIDYLSR